jgi:UDP-N-acetylmuramoyl-L-alanyl-D-glutamate--2,6-diaminopimelate ligase
MKQFIKKLIPPKILGAYHYCLAMLGAIIYGFPSRKLVVIAVTGTKGKSSTVEIIHALLTGAGINAAAASTIRFTIGEISEPNLFKMTMPGRFFLQQFLRKAVNRGATHAVIEMTSEGAKQFRHKAISLDALVFTNLSPEHLESHGSLENYIAAKLSLAKHLEESKKRPRYMIANGDDKVGREFLKTKVEHVLPFTLSVAEPYSVDDKSMRFVWKKGTLFTVPLPGLFNLKNVLAALTLGEAMGLNLEVMHKTLEHMHPISGRAERVSKGQPYAVVVDYAHTPDSLKALFETYKSKHIIAVMGSTGGGRDKWKRPEMGRIAEEYCDTVILANEDPYDEDPQKIVDEIAKGFTKKRPHVILDRRQAIREACREAKEGDVVLITGKGTDPFIMGPHGSKEEWSDKRVAEEELKKLGYN